MNVTEKTKNKLQELYSLMQDNLDKLNYQLTTDEGEDYSVIWEYVEVQNIIWNCEGHSRLSNDYLITYNEETGEYEAVLEDREYYKTASEVLERLLLTAEMDKDYIQ